jgi:DNA-binding transcriptional LysR family regulator
MQREALVGLNAFMAVAEEQSFTRAAAKLGTSQSALSHAIRRLETNLGVRLLTRTTRSVATTDAGERLLATLRPALDSIDAQLNALGELRERPAGKIRITTSGHAAHSLIMPALDRLLPEYPDIEVELSVDSGFRDIVADRFDAGVRLGEAIARDMIAVKIGPELRLVVIASPDYLARRAAPRTPQDLAQHACINLRLSSAGGLYAWELEKKGREVNVRVEGPLVCNDTGLVTRAVLGGHGLGYVMEDSVGEHLRSGRLVTVLDDWCPSFSGYHLYYPSRRQPSAAFSLFVDALRYRP